MVCSYLKIEIFGDNILLPDMQTLYSIFIKFYRHWKGHMDTVLVFVPASYNEKGTTKLCFKNKMDV